MARLTRPPTTWSDDDDEFPDIDALVASKKVQTKKVGFTTQQKPKGSTTMEEPEKPATTVRRRKLGALTDNLLLRAWTPDSAEDDREEKYSFKEDTKPRRTRVELITRNTNPTAIIPSSPADQDEEYVSAKEEVTIIEEVSMFGDTFHSCDSEGSEFIGDDDGEDEDVFGVDTPPSKPPAKPRFQLKDRKTSARSSEDTRGNVEEGRSAAELEEQEEDIPRRAPARGPPKSQDTSSKPTRRREEGKVKGLVDTLSKLQLDEVEEEQPTRAKPSRRSDRETTPPSTPPKSRPGLVSPRKLPRIPTTPHRPNTDMFWSQEFVDDWNDEHSPRKQLFPDAVAARQKSPVKNSPEKKSQKITATKKPSEREAKKTFEKTKHEIASKFLQELDTVITNGKLAELAASTGGIRVVWTNKLNTTAGRANWKRETIRTRQPDGTTTTKQKHHASIELAEKVIDDEHRLLNVLAHEFCHLANFMISGITTNPHGREFKAWAGQCSHVFGDRGIEVTTKHSYDIDFKYVWTCVACGTEFKRHSRSIDPARHRCGSCRSELRQTKPVPRKKKEAGQGPGKVSEYQAFMKEQMRVVKAENPKSPQKEIMKIVASRWAASKASTLEEGVKGVVEGVEGLAV